MKGDTSVLLGVKGLTAAHTCLSPPFGKQFVNVHLLTHLLGLAGRPGRGGEYPGGLVLGLEGSLFLGLLPRLAAVILVPNGGRAQCNSPLETTI